MTNHSYALDRTDVEWPEIARVFDVLIEVLRPRLSKGNIDALSDPWAERYLTPAAESALQRLTALADSQGQASRNRRRFSRNRGSLTSIRLDLRDPIQFDTFRQFAPYSIHAECSTLEGDSPVLSIEDSGNTIIFRTDEATLDMLVGRLGIPRDLFKTVG